MTLVVIEGKGTYAETLLLKHDTPLEQLAYCVRRVDRCSSVVRVPYEQHRFRVLTRKSPLYRSFALNGYNAHSMPYAP